MEKSSPNNDMEIQLKAIKASWIYCQLFLICWIGVSLFISKELPIIPFLLLTTSSLIVEFAKTFYRKKDKK